MKKDPRRKPEAQADPPDLTGVHILFADDNSLNCAFAAALLSETHASVTAAAGGKEALELFAASQEGFYSAVMLDLNMPDMDGFEAARAIRALHRSDSKSVPILSVSAYSTDEIHEHCREAGFTAALSKPFMPEEIFTALVKYIPLK